MNLRICMMGMGLGLGLAIGSQCLAADWYVNDDSTANDVYTTMPGNDANSGTSPSAPKRTLGSLQTNALAPGDVIYIDTGSYGSGIVISNTTAGSLGNPIRFLGSSNGTYFSGAGVNLRVSGSHLVFSNIIVSGGGTGLDLNGARHCLFTRVGIYSNGSQAVYLNNATTNHFQRVVIYIISGAGSSFASATGNERGNYIEDSVLISQQATIFNTSQFIFSNITRSIISGQQAFPSMALAPLTNSYNIFSVQQISSDVETVADLQRLRPTCRFVTSADPLFVDPGRLDFHVQSPAGFVSNGVWVTNPAVAYSPAIDFGPPDHPGWTNEPVPNGGRVNIGLYGGTAEASKSRITPWLYAMSFNDGGNLVRTGRLEWIVSTNLAASTVLLQFSTNNGVTWSNIVSVPATNETYTWVPTVAQQHPAVRWRVVETNSGVASTNARPFSIRITEDAAFSFYINDDSTLADQFCTAIGHDDNLGISPASPKRTLQALLDAYDLEGGDVVYVDTGNYSTAATIRISFFDSGLSNRPVKIVGSPVGALFNRMSTTQHTLELRNVVHLEIENLQITGGNNGVFCNGSTNILFRNVMFASNQFGVAITSPRHTFERCLALDNVQRAVSITSSNNVWQNGIMWGQKASTLIHAISTNGIAVSNSILGNATTLFGSQPVRGEYNLVWDTAVGAGFSTFSALQAGSLGWHWSAYANPEFASVAARNFRLRSVVGRYNPATGLHDIIDSVHSPAIDLGDPNSTAFTNEPAPNGSRLNAGLYGGTAQASLSRTNPWLQVLSFMDGGTLDAQNGAWLRWNGGAIPPDGRVTLWLSRDSGTSWEPMVTNLLFTDGAYFYQNTSTNDPSTLFARWKITLEGSVPEVGSQTTNDFAYKNGNYVFYINDNSTAGDVYCTAVGNDANLGVSPGSPKATLTNVLSRYTLGPGDRIYIDTGHYSNATLVVWTSGDSGSPANPVVVQGSTNFLAGGSLFGLSGSIPSSFSLEFHSGASNVLLRDLILTNVVRGILVTNSHNIRLENVQVRGATSRAFDIQGPSRDIELVRCVAHGGNVGFYQINPATNIFVRHCVFWDNLNALFLGSPIGLTLENNVLASTVTNAVLISYVSATLGGFNSDYNGIHAGPLSRVALNRTTGAMADNLAAWQMLAPACDRYSIPGNPHLANPGPATASEFAYDYRLKTEQTLGRIRPNGQRTSDNVSSPLLDAGKPGSDYSLEPMPNGFRINIGWCGGSVEASSARSYPWLVPVSYADQGRVSDGLRPLVWIAGGGISNETGRVEISTDGGKTWNVTVTSSVPLTNGIAWWNLTGLPDTPAALWRIICNENTNLWASGTNFFSIRNQPLNIYIATADTNLAVYATGPGASDNWQATAAAPLNSLVTAFDRYDIEPGDRIWIDPGVYEENRPLLIHRKDSGTSNQPVQITGNLQRPFDSVILKRAARTFGANGIQFNNAQNLQLRGFMVSNAWFGIEAQNSLDLQLEWMRVGYCVTNSSFVDSVVDWRHCLVDQNLMAGIQAMNGATVRVVNCIIRDSGKMCLGLEGGVVDVRNSILEAPEAIGEQKSIYFVRSISTRNRLRSDYNALRLGDGASVATYAGGQVDRFMIDWQISTSFSNDLRSCGYDPLYANPTELDFHLKSAHGRFDPATGTFVTNASEPTSRLIDLGDPSSPWTNEPSPNGGRINIGLYGNTPQASKSPATGVLVPLTMSDGGTVRGVVRLYWAWNGLADNTIVDVRFSADGGLTWTNIATNLYVNQGATGLDWATTNFPSTSMGMWSIITVTNNPVIEAKTETLFAVKNDPLVYYVNDGNPLGDVFCSAIGRATNTGLTASSPLDSLERLLSRYKIEHGDTIYVDTGFYPRNAPLVLSYLPQETTNYLVIQGSTNSAAGGTVISNSSYGLGDPQPVLDLLNTRQIELRDLRLHGGDRGLRLRDSFSNRFFHVRSVGSRGHGFELDSRSDHNQFIQCAALLFYRTGFHVAKALSGIPATNNFWGNGVMASEGVDAQGRPISTGALVGVQSGRLLIRNSVFVSRSPSHPIYSIAAGTIRGDYNCYHQMYPSAPFAMVLSDPVPIFGVNVVSLTGPEAFAAWNQSDSNSLAADPLFADLLAGDLHPKSAGGRYDPVTGNFVSDEETSPLIDTADPALPWAQESAPNGRRANIGIYGNHPEASRTPTNGTFVLLTLNHGGVVRGMQTLKWVTRGAATNPGFMMDIYLSTNSGISWLPTPIGSVPATNGIFSWNSALYSSTPTARWRLQSPNFIEWRATSERDFVIHNSNLTYYVNDAATAGDVYCTAPGSLTNSGASPASPLPSVAAMLERHDLEPGDTVLIDTGEYLQELPVPITYLDSGTLTEPVWIRGSTNYPGTRFTGRGWQMWNVSNLKFSNLRFDTPLSALNAILLDMSENVEFEGVDIYGGWGNGFAILAASNISLHNCLVAWAATNGVTSQGSFNTRMDFCTLWSNQAAQIQIRATVFERPYQPGHETSFLSVSNSILMAAGLRRPIYDLRSGNLYANFNNLWRVGGALCALIDQTNFSREIDSLGSWVAVSGQDSRSLSHPPQIANERDGDFHLRSSAGRYDPVTGLFTNDPPAQNSPLIDAGDPTRVCLEPPPNGNRVNIGRYGNMSEASKTPTNGALILISFNDGGRAVGTNVPITWLARGATTGATVKISYSADGGATWTVLTNGIPAHNQVWLWDSTLSQQSVQAKLKLEGSDGTSAENMAFFSVRNQPFSFYINDGNPTNDVYCTAVGHNNNSGLSPAAPMADLNVLLARYDLESGDIVYIDTGIYRTLAPWRIAQADTAGALGLPPVIFQGSTNPLHATILDRAADPIGIQVDYGIGVRLSHLMISNTVGSAVVFNDCHNAAAEWINVRVGNVAFQLSGGEYLRVAHSVVTDCSQGVVVNRWNLNPYAVFPVIEHNVFWGTMGSAIWVEDRCRATARHNIYSVAPGQYVYSLEALGNIQSDYNAFWLANGGRVLRQSQSRLISPVPLIYDTVGAWSAASGQDLRSYEGDPLLVNPAARNFYLQSRAGRWDPASGTWTNDPVSSPLIDAGDPASTAWTNEPADANGRRVNIGLHGGTSWASKSETNSALHLLSLNRGGVASGQIALNWKASGNATGHWVRIDVSLDKGENWIRVADNVAANIGGVIWNSVNAGSSPLVVWRVQDLDEPGVEAVSESPFVLHNGPIYYYVNDDTTINDIYCTAMGRSTNSGVRSNSPKRWLTEILDTYNLEPGDIVFVDSGIYQSEQPIFIGDLDAGDISQNPNRQVIIQGATNSPFGETIFIVTQPEESAFQMVDTYGVRLKSLMVMAASNGLSMSNCYFIAGERLTIRDCFNGADILYASNVLFTQSAFVGNRNSGISFSSSPLGDMGVGSCLFWSNRFGIFLRHGGLNVTNTILGMLSPDSYGFFVRQDASYWRLRSDYNNVYVAHPQACAGGLLAGAGASARTSTYYSLSSWAVAMGQDLHSLAHNPLLADPANGDYHLKSAGGRYLPGFGWTNDPVSSPLIDAGNPASPEWIEEPDPNGRRINIGIYGGTSEASKTPTTGWLTLVNLNDGGSAQGQIELKWAVGGAATNYTVCLEYSPDNGLTWSNIVCDWPANSRSYLWNSVPYGRSAQGLWRAYCQQDLSIIATSISPFILRNGGMIPYYVNDNSTVGDVYCTAPGDNANNGLTPATPKASVQAILNAYELAPEDVIFVDAGTYFAGAPPITIGLMDSGWSNLYVTIQGSTNPVAPTVFQAPSLLTPSVFEFNYTVNVRLRDLIIRSGIIGVKAMLANGCALENVRIENSRDVSISLDRCESFHLRNSVCWKQTVVPRGAHVELSASRIHAVNSTLWGAPVAFSIVSGGLTVTNCAIEASSSGGRIYLFGLAANATNNYSGDYNSYWRRDGALLAEQQRLTGNNLFYNDLAVWGDLASADRHSMTLDPLFADPFNGIFHPRSTAGRWTPSGWTNDHVLSPLIDAGSPTMPYDNEPAPNGGYINIGAYGNTWQASKTQTNPPWLRAVSFNEGGVIVSNALLYWLHGGLPNHALVRLEYSTDYEYTWTPIASNIPVGTREYLWDASNIPLTLALNWRVVLQSDPAIFDVSDVSVAVKTRNFDFFINDASTTGDVYCTGPGLDWNPYQPYGTNAAFPLKSLTNLLANYPVGAGDRIFIDTGVYWFTNGIAALFDSRNAGTEQSPLRIYGSTNFAAGGTLFRGNWRFSGLSIHNTRNIEINNVRIEQALHGIALLNGADIKLCGVEVFNSSNGIWASGGGDIEINNARLWRNRRYGYQTMGQMGLRSVVQSTLWGNQLGGIWNDSVAVVSNCILVSTGNAPLFVESGYATFQGDYNLFWVPPGGQIGTNSFENSIYSNLRQWQNKNRDLYSLVADPLFADPHNGDFHLQSRAGFWSNWVWTTSTQTSWAIDAGDPASTAYTNEPLPHGHRLDIGAYGGTRQASASDSSVPGILPVSLADGGIAPDGQPLYWLYRGLAPTNLVTLRFSADGGSTWQTIETGVRIDSAPYIWLSQNDPSPEALWQVVLQGNTNVFGTTTTFFTYRPRPLVYYVNDNSLAGDVYTTAIGNSTNRGYYPYSPLPSVGEILARYQLSGGDSIRVDTGIYPLSEPIVFSVLNSGLPGNPVALIGSTNLNAGGSLLQGDPAQSIIGILIDNRAHDIHLSHLRLTGFSNGVSIVMNTERIALSSLDIQGSVHAGINIVQGRDIHMSRVLIRDGEAMAIASEGSSYSLEDCVIWSNRGSALIIDRGSVLITNTVIETSGSENFCYYSATSITVRANYNNYFIRNGAQIASLMGMQYDKMPQWVRASGQDRQSLSTDPLFHDPANGDFHLRSAAGRWDPALNSWVNDNEFSPLIDMGAPRLAWSNEPAPNGGRRNIGLHGNTPYASKSNTNRWLQTITAMSGGLLFGGVNLVWGYGNAIPSNEIVRVEYSYDNGEEFWVRIGETIVGAGEFYWQSDRKQAGNEIWLSSPAGRWRIYLLSDTNVVDMTDTYFGLRNSPFRYYVNDDSVINDVFTTNAPGNDSNWGFLWRPKRNLSALLEAVDLEPTDEVYIDTGLYPILTSNEIVRWVAADGGASGQPVLVRGSHHPQGSLIYATNSWDGMLLVNASHLDIQDLRFAGDSIRLQGANLQARNVQLSNGVLMVNCVDSAIDTARIDRGGFQLAGQNVRMYGSEVRWGEAVMLGTNIFLSNTVIYATNAGATGLIVNAVNAVVSNCTIVSTRGTAVTKRGPGTLRMGHNILMAGGGDAHHVIHWLDGGLISDWNNLVAYNETWIGTRNGKWEKLSYWQEASGQDANSVSFDPRFQNMLAGDFHLNSEEGRWNPIAGVWDKDPGDHSPVIDLGNPLIGAGYEPLPNGGRRNLGAYGGTIYASKSRTNFWVTALTQNDGGVLKGSNIVLRWIAGGVGAANKTVNLQYSDGTAWVNIVTGLSATAGSYVWNSTTGFNDSFNARWRVVDAGDPGVFDATDNPFALRNHPAQFYVNDDSLSGDYYCSATGSAANDGLATNRPKRTLQQILNQYDLEPNDIVNVDAGTYLLTNDVRLIWSRSGESGKEVLIRGHPEGPHTLFDRGWAAFPAVAFDVKASHVRLENLGIQNAHRGILLESNQNISVRGVDISGGTAGVEASAVHRLAVRNSSFWWTHYGLNLVNTRTSVLENLTFALTRSASIQLAGTIADTIQNNIYIPETNSVVYAVSGALSLLANAFIDYNLYDFGRTNVAFFEDSTNTLRSWQLSFSNDFRSAVTNADLADIEYAKDFHPKSMYGRWTPAGWIMDEDILSWAVDHGNPFSDYSQEPQPHGNRINIGRYGNTPQASKGFTNAFYEIRTLNEEGIEIPPDDQFWPLIWSAHLIPTSDWVYVQFSGDGGSNWVTLATNRAYTEYFIWRATPEFITVAGRWRVIGVDPPYVEGRSAYDFIYRPYEFGIHRRPYSVLGLMRFDWRGGVQGRRYLIEYSDDFGKTWKQWPARFNGPAAIHKNNFVIPPGEAALTYTFEDRTSYLQSQRWYRIWEIRE